MKDRYLFLDVLRIMAMLLVAYTHLFSCASYSESLPYITNSTDLPLIPQNIFCNFEIFLNKLNTNPASLRVALFFLITGFLMPMMMERYSRIEFLINRILRIFPTMIIATVIIGIFLYYSQGIVFRPSAYINSWFLTFYISGTPAITGVLWTLVIEVMFYIICFITGKFNYKKLFTMQFLVLLTILLGFWKVFILCKFLMCILVGSSIYLTTTEKNICKRFSIILFSLVMYILAFKLGTYFEHDYNYHYTFSTQILVSLLFIVVMFLISKVNVVDRIKVKIRECAKLVYPMYLLHCSIGLALIENIRHNTMLSSISWSGYLIIIPAIIAMSFVLHKIIEEPSINLSKKVIENMRK